MVTLAGVGTSHHRNPKAAGREAAEMALQKAGIQTPDFVFMFASVGYNQPALLQAVREVTQNAPLCGCSGEGIIARDEADESNFSVAVMVICSDEFRLSHGLSIGLKANPASVGAEVAQGIQTQNITEPVALFVFADGLTFNFDRFVQGLESTLQLTQNLPLFGGVSADNWEFKRTYQYCDDQVVSDGVAWACLSGHVQIAWSVTHGCTPIGEKRIVTRCEDNLIYEIDHKPVLEVLKEYLIGDEIDNWQKAVINLCLGFKTPGHLKDYDDYLIRFIPGKDDVAGSISIQTEVTPGSEIWMTRRDQERITQGVERMANLVAQQLGSASPKIMFQFDCCGRGKVFFRDQQKLQLLQSLQKNWSTDLPWLGFYTLGEIGPVGEYNCFHNYTAVLMALY